MIVVSDTTALTTLIKAQMEHLLPGLFGQVKVPQAVALELLQFHPQLPNWCQIESARESRRQAEALGLTCLALPAVMVAAKRQGLISSVAEAFATLAAKGRYGVAESTASVLLRSVGEA